MKALKFQGIFEGNPRKILNFRGEAEGMIFEDFDHPTTDPIFTELKDLYLLKRHIKNQEAGRILKVFIALSK